jgi:hypothetical protein
VKERQWVRRKQTANGFDEGCGLKAGHRAGNGYSAQESWMAEYTPELPNTQ